MMMKRGIAGALLLATAACTTAYGEDVGVEPMPGAGMCDADDARALIGRQASSALGAEALERTGARGLRWIQPGTVVTMDYRPDRLNIKLDARNIVEGFTCG